MISLEKLARRDKWICHICDQRVERIEDASREHLNPRHLGGSKIDPRNIKLAHKWCNELKGKRYFSVEQDKGGWVIVDPNGNKSDPHLTYSKALEIAQELNEDKLYLDKRYK